MGPDALNPGLTQGSALSVQSTQLALQLRPRVFFYTLVLLAGQIPQALAVRTPSALHVGVDLPRLVSDGRQMSLLPVSESRRWYPLRTVV